MKPVVIKVKGRRGFSTLPQAGAPAFGGHPGQGVGSASPAPSQEVAAKPKPPKAPAPEQFTAEQLQERLGKVLAAQAAATTSANRDTIKKRAGRLRARLRRCIHAKPPKSRAGGLRNGNEA